MPVLAAMPSSPRRLATCRSVRLSPGTASLRHTGHAGSRRGDANPGHPLPDGGVTLQHRRVIDALFANFKSIVTRHGLNRLDIGSAAPSRRPAPIRRAAMRLSHLAGATIGLALAALLAAGPAAAENGVSAQAILFGQAAALNGPAAELGQGMRQGLLAAFQEANKAGGINGHELDLISLDDGYEPGKSIAAAQKLIDDNKVFALVGSVGTPTSTAVQPIASEAGVPFIGAFTGAEFLRDPYKPAVVNVRASYYQETEMMVDHLAKDLGVTRIAIFYQDDAFGRAGLAGVNRALDKRGMALVADGTYERNTTAVKAALLSIMKGKPEAVIMIGAYQPCAAFIKLARQVKLNAIFVNISFVGSDALAKELGPDGAGVVITQVVPLPDDTAIPLVKRYRAALRETSPDAKPGFVSLEGYVAGRLVVSALARIDGEITRKALLDTIAHIGTFDLGGVKLVYSAASNRGSSEVFLTVLQPDGTFKSVEKLTKPSS
jgi:branched-chain amino acid transport system substrate-binding protein